MQNTKYQELKDEIQDLRLKVLNQHQLVRPLLIAMKDIDYRIEAVVQLGVRADMFSLDQFEEQADMLRGFRRRGLSEQIAEGDVAWVNYKVWIDDKEEHGEQGMPIRIGSKAVVFEEILIGKFPMQKGIEFSTTFKRGTMAGKTVRFLIDVDKVKERIRSDDELDEQSSGRLAGTDQSHSDTDRSGYQKRSESESNGLSGELRDSGIGVQQGIS